MNRRFPKNALFFVETAGKNKDIQSPPSVMALHNSENILLLLVLAKRQAIYFGFLSSLGLIQLKDQFVFVHVTLPCSSSVDVLMNSKWITLFV